MKWVQSIDEPLFVADGDAVLPDEKKLRMGNNKLLTIRRANGKGPKPTAQPLLQFLHIHILNLSQTTMLVKISPDHGVEEKRMTLGRRHNTTPCTARTPSRQYGARRKVQSPQFSSAGSGP